MSDLRSYGPGKFNLVLDALVHEVSCQSGCDMECGSVQDYGHWFGFMRHGHTIFLDGEPFNEKSLTEAEQDFLTAQAGCIISEDAYGFVHVDYYEDMALLDTAWDQVMEDVAGWEEEMEAQYQR